MRQDPTPPHSMNKEFLTDFRQLRAKSLTREDRARLEQKVFKANYGLVISQANRLHKNSRLEYDDIRQVAAIGLLRAVRKYEPDKGFTFSSYAIALIQGEVMHLIRDSDVGGLKIPRQSKELLSRWRRQQRQNPQFTLQEIAVADLCHQGSSSQTALERYREVCDDCRRKTLSEIDGDGLQCTVSEEMDLTNLQRVLARLPHPYGFVLVSSVESSIACIAEYLQVSAEQVESLIVEGRRMLLDRMELSNE